MVDICVYLAVKSKAPDKAPTGGGSGSSFNQLLGIKGAAQETVIPLYTDPFSIFSLRYWKILGSVLVKFFFSIYDKKIKNK